MVNASEVEERLKLFVFEERVRAVDFFRDFDKLNSGYVTPTQFRRVLDAVKLRLSDDEAAALIEKYSRPGRGVNYLSFCDEIDTGTCNLVCS